MNENVTTTRAGREKRVPAGHENGGQNQPWPHLIPVEFSYRLVVPFEHCFAAWIDALH